MDFPEEGLDISEFVLGEKPPLYDLYAVSNHFGMLGGGHYTAHCYNEEYSSWLEFNDANVSKSRGLSQTSAYILYYKSRNL